MNPFGRTAWTRTLPYIGLLPALLLYVVLGIIPSLGTVILSFTDISGVQGAPWHFIGLQNYQELYLTSTLPSNTQGIGIVALRTIVFSVSVTVLQNALALGLAMLLNTRMKGHTFFRSVIFMPVVLGVTVAGLVWELIFNPMGGAAAVVLKWFGATSSFFGSNTLAFPLVIFVQIWMYMGFSLLIFIAGLQSVPTDLYEAADIDGAKRWAKFTSVTFPLIAPTVTINILLAIIGSLQTYDIIYVLTKGNFNTMTLGMMVYNTGFTTGARLGYASAISMIMFVLVLIVTLVSQFYLRRRETEIL